MLYIHRHYNNLSTVSLAYSPATKVLVMNNKGGVGKSTVVAGLISHLLNSGYKTELIDFDRQKSSHDWASHVIPGKTQSYNPSFNSLSTMAAKLKVHRDSDVVILDSPSNFVYEDMARYVYFANHIILPLAPSPVDLHASLPFIKKIIESGLLRKRNISMSFLLNRCITDDKRVQRVSQLLKNFRNYPTLGLISEHECYQEAFFHKTRIHTETDRLVWDNVVKRICNDQLPMTPSQQEDSFQTNQKPVALGRSRKTANEL